MLPKLEQLRKSGARQALRLSVDELAKLYFKRPADRKPVENEDINPELLMHIKELHELTVAWTSTLHRDEPWRDHSDAEQARYWRSIYRVLKVASRADLSELVGFSDEKFYIWCDQNGNKEIALVANSDWIKIINMMLERTKAYQKVQDASFS